jgi:hypothetical protein
MLAMIAAAGGLAVESSVRGTAALTGSGSSNTLWSWISPSQYRNPSKN